MNICFITKYPPIEGGVSMRCYWLARGLAQRGHTVVVVTNSTEVEADYRIRMTEHDRAWYESAFPETGGAVIVKNSTPASERIRYIPFANPYVTKLATLAQHRRARLLDDLCLLPRAVWHRGVPRLAVDRAPVYRAPRRQRPRPPDERSGSARRVS